MNTESLLTFKSRHTESYTEPLHRVVTYIQSLVQFCFKCKTKTMQPPVFLVLAFLHLLQNSGVGYSEPNTACSFLSFFCYKTRLWS